jgi:hypothetical protein
MHYLIVVNHGLLHLAKGLTHLAIALFETRIPIFFARIPAPFSTVLVVFVKDRVFYEFATAMAMGLIVKRLLHRKIVFFGVARQLHLFFT